MAKTMAEDQQPQQAQLEALDARIEAVVERTLARHLPRLAELRNPVPGSKFLLALAFSCSPERDDE